ncbi:MAG TPA: ATP-binding protein [Rhodocyclaceae bacterium]|nr:ATP-binding protein [Rhodocyclaceae bacterium]
MSAEDILRDQLARVEVLLALNEQASGSSLQERDFLLFGLQEAEWLTASPAGFLHFVNDDQETLDLTAWTAGTLTHCEIPHHRHYPISQAGIWAGCFYTRKPVVCNDYGAIQDKKGLPEGHLGISRLITVPVVEGDKVRLILGVGNKDRDYTAYDTETLQLIGDALWRIVHARRMDVSLAESSERFLTIFNTIGEAIFLYDAGMHQFVDMNEAATQMFGYSRDEVLNIAADPGPDDASVPADTIRTWIEKATEEGQQTFEWQAQRRSGESFWVSVNARTTSIGGRDLLLVVVDDISKRKSDEAAMRAQMDELVALNAKLEGAHLQLLQSEKMASIGQLAAGVAHEINNPVGFIHSNMGSLEKYLRDFTTLLDAYERAEDAMDEVTRSSVRQLRQDMDIAFLRDDVFALLAETLDGVNRVKKIVQDMKDFSRAGANEEWQWADLYRCLDSTLNIVRNELKYKARISKEYAPLPQIYCLPSQLNQVFMNLLINAAHAIETQGTITIRTGQEGEQVWVEIEDSGHGIPPDNLQRIFDPFYSTKPVGKGTGLGLFVSYNIVHKHQGKIEVRSEVGKGSTFRVWLPIQAQMDEGGQED